MSVQRLNDEIATLERQAGEFDQQAVELRAQVEAAAGVLGAAEGGAEAAELTQLACSARASFFEAQAVRARALIARKQRERDELAVDETVDNAQRAVVEALRAEYNQLLAVEVAALEPVRQLEADQAARLKALLETFAAERADAAGAVVTWQEARQRAHEARSRGLDVVDSYYTEIAGRPADQAYERGYGPEAVARAERFKAGRAFQLVPSRESVNGLRALEKVAEAFFKKKFD